MPKVKNGINKEYLIHLVHKRPAIWDKNSDAYKDKMLKLKSWREICAILNSKFEQMEESQGQEYMRGIVRLWSQTRDSWMRTQQGKKRSHALRPYIYHKQLAFLKTILPKTVSKETQADTESAESRTTNQEDEAETQVKQEKDVLEVDGESSEEDEEEYQVPTYSSVDEESQDIAKKRRESEFMNEEFEDQDIAKKRRSETEFVNEEFVDVGARLRRIDEIDERIASYMSRRMLHTGTVQEDRHLAFFRSIQPSLALLDDDQILEFQSGVITLLQNIKRGRTVD